MGLYSPEREEELENAMKEVLREAAAMTSRHFGQPHMNAATMAGSYRMALKKLAGRYGKTFLTAPVAPGKPWWM